MKPETEMPGRRIAFFGGIWCFSNSKARLERLLAVSMTATNLLRVINSRSEGFTLSVAVWPRGRGRAMTPDLVDQRPQLRELTDVEFLGRSQIV
jgi:hypothetical protein